MKHHYNKEELIELKRKYDMQVSKETIEEIKHTIDLDREIERLSKEVDMWNKKYNEQFDIINKLEKYLEEEKDRLARGTSNIYDDSLGETRLVNEDIFNEIIIIQDKIKSLKGDSSNGKTFENND